MVVSVCYAQDSRTVILKFQQDTLPDVAIGSNISNRLIIRNNYREPVTLVKIFQDSLALISLPDTLHLAPQEEKSAFTKYFVTPALLRNTDNHIIVRYKILSDKVSLHQRRLYRDRFYTCTKILPRRVDRTEQ